VSLIDLASYRKVTGTVKEKHTREHIAIAHIGLAVFINIASLLNAVHGIQAHIAFNTRRSKFGRELKKAR
jgi:hypothetical protein